MLHLLKRHPFSVSALSPPVIGPDVRVSKRHLAAAPAARPRSGYLRRVWLSCNRHGQTERLRPSFLPAALGRNFFLTGYRIFARLASHAGSLRGLRILRSDTNRRWMVSAGNVLTHYQYRLCQAELSERPGEVEWNIRTPRQEADLRVIMHLADGPAGLPAGSPFPNLNEGRRFAGPLPYTFDYEPETHSIIRIQGVRREWHPKPVTVEVLQNTFLHSEPFCRAKPILANAFQVHDVPYRWERGIRTPVESV